MWQRLRAARDYGKKTQAHIAEHIGTVSRGAVAQWEANTPGLRTNPSAVQALQFAQACGVPVEWLLDDTQRIDGLHSYMQSRRASAAPQSHALKEAAAAKAFWSAVQFQAILLNPVLADRFNVPVKLDGLERSAPFLDGKHLAAFAACNEDWRSVLVREVQELLIIEMGVGHTCDKAVFLWSATPMVATKDMTTFAKRLSCTLVFAHDVNDAAQMLATAYK